MAGTLSATACFTITPQHTSHKDIAMRKFVLPLLISLVSCSACAADPATRGPAAPAPAKASVSVATLDDDAFCQAAHQAGITNTALSNQDADPATLLPAIDALTKLAPASIHDDFLTFDHVEHALLDPASTDRAGLDQPGTHNAMVHVADYLDNACHIGG
jgi:hypothetical protein